VLDLRFQLFSNVLGSGYLVDFEGEVQAGPFRSLRGNRAHEEFQTVDDFLSNLLMFFLQCLIGFHIDFFIQASIYARFDNEGKRKSQIFFGKKARNATAALFDSGIG